MDLQPCLIHDSSLSSFILSLSFFLFFFFLAAAHAVYGNSQARRQIRAATRAYTATTSATYATACSNTGPLTH